ncbi:PAS domain S-box-containing protein [Bacillus sp. SORGH_AS 510]|uniref:ATP-binding protein n=1 Tax=Bacillus sp. SORGH_AS_0510 TaxID=3041771 RepID=UPI002787BE20|nr:ATP-binding protein [Bacillus sp. SORGH_AS_0510]MDQ1147877.1 PAS domain S-box-containing protein [Bacillus sp. SORGH_AS_0510]
MILLDYIMNLAIFSLMVSTPLVVRSFIKHKPFKRVKLWVGLYGGIVSIILVILSIHQEGYSYDIRYAPVILVFTYLGPIAGFITGVFSLLMRLYSSGQWMPAIIGWSVIMISFSIIHVYISRLTAIKKGAILSGAYVIIYVITVPGLFNVLRDKPMFHFQYLIFVMLGVIIGSLLIESYVKLHRLNNRLSDMNTMLEESESKYRIIAENTSDLIMVMNQDHSISYFSPSHEMVLGFQASELEKFELCKFIHPDDVCLFKNTVKTMFEQKESQALEFRLKHKEGYYIEFESRCMPVTGEGQSVEHIVIISRDISERKKSEEILLQSEKLSIVGELAAGVAHEIRNPLTTIKGFLQLYRGENTAIDRLLLTELERIEGITSELLSLGKPQAVQLNRTDLKELLEDTLELLSPEALMNDIQIKLLMEETDFFITCERNQVKQVFLNILKNAMESMKDGGEISVDLRKSSEGECLILVQDQGCGIPEELLPRLGEPFYSLKEKGTGLGVMICHKILKQHHGSISYKSKINEGTLVEITLPLAN